MSSRILIERQCVLVAQQHRFPDMVSTMVQSELDRESSNEINRLAHPLMFEWE